MYNKINSLTFIKLQNKLAFLVKVQLYLINVCVL